MAEHIACCFSLCVLCAAPGAAAQPFSRQIDAIPVRDAAGEAYTHPWLGGLNVPRPQFVDIDADGDPDLFLQERSGALMFFENTGTPAAHRFTWRTDAYAGLDVGEWARFADVDGDGDFDVLAEEPFSLVRVYRNTGTPARPRFLLAVDTLRATYLTPSGAVRDTLVFSDRQNLPALADVDCDGDLDLFAASVFGYVTFYENLGPGNDGLPALRFVTDRYQDIEIIGGVGKHTQPGGARHGATAIAFADVDADGDPDLFWGDFFSASLYFLRNDGACPAPDLALASEVFPLDDPLRTSGYNTPAFTDIDADGDLDLFVGVQGGAFAAGPFPNDNFYFYRHNGGMAFNLETGQFIAGLDAGEESMPAFADLDGDGDLDLFVGNRIDPSDPRSANLYFFENEGSEDAPSFRLAAQDFVDPGGGFNRAPAFADLDADGDLDLVVGAFDGTLAYFRNDGTPEAPALVAAGPAAAGFQTGTPDVGQNSTPAFADLDADGDLDLVVGESAGTVNFFRNAGTPRAPAFVLETEMLAGLDAGARSIPALADLNADGTLDLVVGTDRSELVVLLNTGTPQAPAFAPAAPFDLPGTVPHLAAPAFADLDADGDADVFIGARTGGVFFYRNDRIRTAAEVPPEAPSGALLSNYPNPFGAATTLRLRLPRGGRARLVVYDALGRAVARLLDGVLPPGDHRLLFDAGTLPAGVYFYTLTLDGGTAATATMLQMR